MVDFCMRGCAKAVGLSALSFCLGIVAGLFFPVAVVAVMEMILLITFGYLCLFKW